MLIAYVLAFPIGWNREKEERSAGLRTFPLVAVASCGFIQAAETLAAGHPEAMARIIEGLIAGMGFIGGGAILRQRGFGEGHRHRREPLGHRRDRRRRRPRQLRCRGRARRGPFITLWLLPPLKKMADLEDEEARPPRAKRRPTRRS